MFEDVKHSARELALLKYKDEPEEALRELVKRNAAQGLSNTGLSDADLALKARLSGENEGIVEILEWRKKAEETRIVKCKEWHDKLPERKAAAILNLPNAASANGQLVAAILEDAPEGLTQKQIASWCEELSAVPEADFKALLEGLVNEHIIAKGKGGRYRLLNILDASMKYSAAYLASVLSTEEDGVKVVMAFLNQSRDPVCIQDINKTLGMKNDAVQDDVREMNSMWNLTYLGVAQEAFVVKTGPNAQDARHYYAPTLLGEVTDE